MGDHQSNTMTAEQNNFAMRGVLAGHAGWVTSIVTSQENPDTILSSSRDKTVIVWQLTREDTEYGFPKRALTGHSHFVQDVKISSDGLFALSGSWDGTLRLWDICTGRTTRRFVGHSKDVLSVAFSVDNRQIVSASRDKSIKLWNTLGECKYTIGEPGGAEGHTEGVSCVNFVPNQQNPSIVSGGRDGVAMLWDLNEGKRLYSLPCEQGDIIHALCFSPNRYWLCAGTDTGIRIWDLEGKGIVDELKLELPVRDPKSKALPTSCISLAWSSDGNTLFAGYTDTMIRAWQVTAGQNTIF